MPYEPVQVQKLFFLLDENAASGIGGKKFNFRPYDYGPFDRAVYDEIEALAGEGLIEVYGDGRSRRYSLTLAGIDRAAELLESLPPRVRKYMGDVSKWVQSQSFEDLVATIYEHYPEMAVNSVFRPA